jgi:WD40 repeat protein
MSARLGTLATFLVLTTTLVPPAPSRVSGQHKAARVDSHGVPLPPGALARLGTMRWRQQGGVTAVAFSPDGKVLAVGSGPQDGSIYLRDPRTGRVLRRLQGHTREVHTLLYSPDGKVLASGSDDETTRLWDVATGKELHRLRGDGRALVFSRTGELLATATVKLPPRTRGRGDGFDGERLPDVTIRLWAVASGQEVRRIEFPRTNLTALAFSPDDKTLASGHHDPMFTGVWQEGKHRKVLRPAAGVRLWEVATGRQRAELGRDVAPSSVHFLSDGKTLLVGDRDSTIRFLELGTGREVRRLFAGTRSPHAKNVFQQIGGAVVLALSADAKTLISVCQDETALVWDLGSGKRLRALRGCGYAPSLSLSRDGRLLAVAGHAGTQLVRLWETDSGEAIHTRDGHPGGVYSLAFAPDGKSLASVCSEVLVWDPATGKMRRQLPGWGVVAYSPDGKLLACGNNDQTLRLYAAASGREVLRITAARAGIMYPLTVAFSPDGKLLATESNRAFSLWDVATGRESALLAREDRSAIWRYLREQLDSVAFSPDGRTLAWAAAHTELALWELPPGQNHRKLPQMSVEHIAFSPDGKFLASAGGRPLRGGEGRSLHLWDVATGQSVRKFEGAGAVRVVAFSPDGKLLAGAGADGIVRLWEVATGWLRHRFEGHRAEVRSLAFAPDGRTLASGSMDTTILIWAVPAGLSGVTSGGIEPRRGGGR